MPAEKLFSLYPVWAESKVVSVKPAKPDKHGFSNARITAKVTTSTMGIRPGRTLTFVAMVDNSCSSPTPKPGDDFTLYGYFEKGEYSEAGPCSPGSDDSEKFSSLTKARREEFARLEAAAAADKGVGALDRLSAFLIEKHDWPAALDALQEAQRKEPRGDRTYETALALSGSREQTKAMTLLRHAGDRDARAKILLAGLQPAAKDSDFGPGACKGEVRRLDMAGHSLSGRNLTQLPLLGLDVTGLDARGADLTSANLRCTKLEAAQLNGADLKKADLRGADLSTADLSGADLDGALTDCSTKLPPVHKSGQKCE